MSQQPTPPTLRQSRINSPSVYLINYYKYILQVITIEIANQINFLDSIFTQAAISIPMFLHIVDLSLEFVSKQTLVYKIVNESTIH